MPLSILRVGVIRIMLVNRHRHRRRIVIVIKHCRVVRIRGIAALRHPATRKPRRVRQISTVSRVLMARIMRVRRIRTPIQSPQTIHCRPHHRLQGSLVCVVRVRSL
jgi:hypothetical protein